jgi:hypothetical protein
MHSMSNHQKTHGCVSHGFFFSEKRMGCGPFSYNDTGRCHDVIQKKKRKEY